MIQDTMGVTIGVECPKSSSRGGPTVGVTLLSRREGVEGPVVCGLSDLRQVRSDVGRPVRHKVPIDPFPGSGGLDIKWTSRLEVFSG